VWSRNTMRRAQRQRETTGMVKDLIGEAFASACQAGCEGTQLGEPHLTLWSAGRRRLRYRAQGHRRPPPAAMRPMAAARSAGRTTKVDLRQPTRRVIAKNVVAASLAEVHIQLLCDRRRRSDVALCRHPRHPGADERSARRCKRFPAAPTSIRRLSSSAIYKRTCHGHGTRRKRRRFSWERTDLADACKRALR
jgi:hypothetical protein